MEEFSFNATTAFLLRLSGSGHWAGRREFQCHHGVPASRGGGLMSAISLL